MTSFGRALIVLACASLASCVSVEEVERRADADIAEAGADAGRRGGFDAAVGRGLSDETIREQVRLRLAEPLDADRAVEIALLNDRGLHADLESVGLARADLEAAALLPNPHVGLSVEFYGPGKEIGAGLLQSLVAILRRPIRKGIAKATLDRERHRLASRIIGVAFDVRRKVLALEVAERTVVARAESLGAAAASVSLTTQLHDAGNITELQLARAHDMEARARLSLAAAEQARTEARHDVDARLGLWGADIVWSLQDVTWSEPVAVTPSDLESRAVAASLEVAAARAEVDRAARAVGLADWEGAFPAIDVGVDSTRENDGLFGIGPSIEIELPLFDQGQGRRVRANAVLRAALANYWATAVAVRGAARRLRDRHNAWVERAIYLRDVMLPIRERVVTETLRQYNSMQVGAFKVLDARRAEISSQEEYVVTWFRVQQARLDLDELLSGRMSDARFPMMQMPRSAESLMPEEEH